MPPPPPIFIKIQFTLLLVLFNFPRPYLVYNIEFIHVREKKQHRQHKKRLVELNY